jgi:hypothetical protein
MEDPAPDNGELSDGSVSMGPRLALPVDPTQIRAGVPIIAVRFRDSSEFMRALDPDRGPAGEISIATRAVHQPGTDVVLEVRWPALPNRVYMRARAQRCAIPEIRVFRIYPFEQAKMEFLVASAHGDTGEVQRRSHRRYCVRLPVRWRPFGSRDMHAGVAEDLSASGVRIVSPFLVIDVGERVVVRIQADAVAQELVLTGTVRHVHLKTLDELALGVIFEHRSSGEQRNLRCLLHAFAAKGLVLFDE